MLEKFIRFILGHIMKKELTVIIPTLQKNPLFPLLLRNLHQDPGVKEIIIIDNSTQGFSFPSPKIRVLEVEENIFVNPAWNLGMRHCKTDYWCLMNDDIMLCPFFCSLVLDLLQPDMGTVGILGDHVKCVDLSTYKLPIAHAETMFLRKMYSLCYCFGIAMFGHKDAYIPIPEELKVFFGDNYLIYTNRIRGRQNYAIAGQPLYHLGSLSSKTLEHLCQEELPIYEKYCKKYSLKQAAKNSLQNFNS